MTVNEKDYENQNTENRTESDNNLEIDEYTFETFIVGTSNKFAHATALAVSDFSNPKNYNPLFIYGESGLGKTHLLYAIRHAVESKFPQKNVVYVKGEEFLNELILAIQQSKNVEFREKYRSADLFLMDDIQFIAGKMATQDEFFHTFNTLFELGKQIVFTSDRPPKDIQQLADRLKSRFDQALLADIQPPDETLRIAIIRNKAETLGVVLPDDVINYIADNLDSSVRQLEGAVKMIIAYRDIMDDDITIENVKVLLKNLATEGGFIPSPELIIEETAKYYNQTPEDVIGQSRVADTALSRQIAMYLIRKLTNFSLKDTGRVFDNRDHSTVLTSIRKVEKKIKDDNDFSNIIKNITSNINSKTSSR